MFNKLVLLSLTAISAALFALPAVASAESWHFEPASNFTIKNTSALTLTTAGGTDVGCSGIKGEGSFDAGSTTTGKVAVLAFTGCTGPLGVSCTGEDTPTAAGEVKGTNLIFHLIMIDKGTPGILLTPSSLTPDGSGEGVFASFTCFGITTLLEGNGVIMDVENLCQTKIKELKVNFQRSATGVQKYQQITTTGTKFDLTTKVGGGGFETSSVDGTGITTTANEGLINCTSA